jgi:NitT/TauT family transport system substrate-binding protein
MEFEQRQRKGTARWSLPRRTFLGQAAAVCALGGMVAGCTEERAETLRLGCNSWLGYAPLYIARDRGLLEQACTRLVEIPNSASVQRALRNQNIELAALTLDEVIRVHADGVPCRILWVADISAGGDAIVARHGISSVRDLKGKKIGVEDGALGAYVLQRCLDLHHMSLSDLVIKNVTPAEHERAFIDGTVDAVVTFEPMLGRLLEQGASLLFSSREIPWEVIDVVVTRADIAENRQEDLVKLASAWFSVLGEVVGHSSQVMERLARREQQSPEQIARAFEGIIFPDRKSTLEVLENTYGLEQGINRLIEFQLSRDPHMKAFRAREIVDLALCRRLLGEGA